MGVRVRERDGAWWLYVCHKGKRTARRVGIGVSGKKAAHKAKEQIEAKLALGDFGILEAPKPAMQGPTFEAVASEWERMTAPNWKKGTQITYANALRHRILPAFGSLPISEVTPSAIESWWAKTRAEGLSKQRLGVLRHITSEICRRAVRLELLRSNPVECIEGGLGREDREVRKADYLVSEDLTRFLETTKTVCLKESPILLVMATGGVRLGEAVALQVGDLDVAGLQVHIRRMVRRGYISSPKSGKSRVVDLPASTIAVLEKVRQTRQAESAYEGIEARWLFPGKVEGKPITPEAVQRAFHKALRAAGIRRLRAHDMRHTYATLAIMSGVPLLTVSRQLGHAGIGTTADIYAHAVPGSNKAAADAMEAILTSNQMQPPRNLAEHASVISTT